MRTLADGTCPRCGSALSTERNTSGATVFLSVSCPHCDRPYSETVRDAQQQERRFLAFMGIALAIVACTVSFAAVMLYTAVRYGIGGQ